MEPGRCFCWVFSFVQRKDRPSYETARTGLSNGRHRQAAGETGTKCCPQKGDNMDLVLVYKCGQEKSNNLYYQAKE